MSKALIVAGGILAFLLLSYLCATMHTPAVATGTALVQPTLAAAIIEGRVTLAGTVADEATRQQIIDEASSVYGTENIVNEIALSSGVEKASWFPAGLGMFNFLRDGVKRAGFRFQDTTLTVTGVVKNADVENKLLAHIRAAFPSLPVVDNVELEASVVQNDIARFLESRTIDFAAGSAVILPRGKEVLDTVAIMLAEAPDALIEVSGHTDNRGNAESNHILSQRRADATEAYLVRKGIADHRMTSNGYGSTRPVADNATAEGRQRNRRIQFGLR